MAAFHLTLEEFKLRHTEGIEVCERGEAGRHDGPGPPAGYPGLNSDTLAKRKTKITTDGSNRLVRLTSLVLLGFCLVA